VKLPPLVYLLGLVSFLMDVASEMVYPLLPLFLAGLGATPTAIGLVEGVAEATASLFKVVGGRLSDRIGRRRPFLLLGYGLPALFRPILALAQSPWHVLLYRFLDRTGKGLRTAPGMPSSPRASPRRPWAGPTASTGAWTPWGPPWAPSWPFCSCPFWACGGSSGSPPSPPLWRPSFSFF
jgi:MFS family permease